MAFWHKDKAKEILRELETIEKRINNLKELEEKKNAAHHTINKCKSNIDDVKQEISEVAEEHKGTPWLDSSYDTQIDLLAASETKELDKLKQNLDGYEDMLNKEVKSKDDLDAFVNFLKEEVEGIREREKRNGAELAKMEQQTVARRYLARSATPPAGNTSDGVPWSNIVNVSRALGGWLVLTPGGNHPAALHFPNETRSVPLSHDVSHRALATQIRAQLTLSLGQKKTPKTARLASAFNAGDYHRAV